MKKEYWASTNIPYSWRGRLFSLLCNILIPKAVRQHWVRQRRADVDRMNTGGPFMPPPFWEEL